MDDAIQGFVLALASERKSSPNTLGAYRTDLRQLSDFVQRLGAKTWADVTPAMIADFVLHLRERQYATTSIARKVAALKSFFHYLISAQSLSRDPADAVQAVLAAAAQAAQGAPGQATAGRAAPGQADAPWPAASATTPRPRP